MDSEPQEQNGQGGGDAPSMEPQDASAQGTTTAPGAWYHDKQNLALATGFLSTGLTIINILVGTISTSM